MTASERLKLREHLATEFEIDTSMLWLLCVAMMRLGAKRDPYRALANAMADTTRNPSHCLSQDPGRAFGGGRILKGADSVRFAGECSPKLRDLCGGRPFRLAGLPVVAGYTPGTATTVDDDKTSILTNTGDAHFSPERWIGYCNIEDSLGHVRDR